MLTSTPTNVYESLGITPVINARGNNTVLGGSTPSARVRRAMQDVERYYVDMQQLLERSGQVIAGLLNAEAAHVTPGAAAALALGSAACIAGTDPDKMARLPDTSGMANKILIQAGHRYHYERAATVPGGRLVEVGEKSGTTPDQLRSALGQDVAAVMFPAHPDATPATLSPAHSLPTAHPRRAPVPL